MRTGITIVLAAAVGLMMTMSASAGDPEYVGSKSCKKCHIKIYKSWEKGAKAKTLDALKPGEASEAKTKHGLDTAKDYSKDESCLACHSVGFGKPGGYAAPAEGDEAAAKKAKALAGVGCESCHGPGKSPTFEGFDFAAAKDKGVHEHVALKLRK